jgi:hypothetical protein
MPSLALGAKVARVQMPNGDSYEPGGLWSEMRIGEVNGQGAPVPTIECYANGDTFGDTLLKVINFAHCESVLLVGEES